MNPEENHAHELHRLLSEAAMASVELRVEGEGVHWHVDVVGQERRCRVHCFNYDDASGALRLGLRGNAHLSKVAVGELHHHVAGVEYAISFQLGDNKSATGRTQDDEEVLSAVRDWVVGERSLDQMYELHAFVDAQQRARQRIAEEINARFAESGSKHRVVCEGDSLSEFSELWIYADERSARLERGSGDSVSIALLLHRTQLVRGEGLEPAFAARILLLWFEHRANLEALQQSAPGLTFAHLAAELERGDYSAWHWGNVLLQSEQDDVLAYYKPLIERIAHDEDTSRFFSFTSLDRLCFSRCSLYPFDTRGLPMVAPALDSTGGDAFAVVLGRAAGQVGTAEEAFTFIKSVLARDTHRTWYGTIEEHLADRLNHELELRGSSLRARQRQVKQWLCIEVVAESGRRCEVMSRYSDDLTIRLVAPRTKPHREREFEGSVDKAAERVIAWLSDDGAE